MQVKEIMTENPACCTSDTNLQEVAKMMVENDCGCCCGRKDYLHQWGI